MGWWSPISKWLPWSKSAPEPTKPVPGPTLPFTSAVPSKCAIPDPVAAAAAAGEFGLVPKLVCFCPASKTAGGMADLLGRAGQKAKEITFLSHLCDTFTAVIDILLH